MGQPTTNAYANKTLPTNVSTAYENALGSAGNMAGAGSSVWGDAQDYVGSAGDIYGDMAEGQGPMATMNPQPYMNPFTQNVIDRSMLELNRQEDLQQEGVDATAGAQNAFGGDRWHIQKAAMNRDFDRLRKDTIADLYLKNFQNAQEMGKFDVDARFRAGAGMSDLAKMLGGAGIDLTKFGTSALGDLANMGFGWGNDLQKNQLAAGALQQGQNQMILDAIKGQFAGYTGAPLNYLQTYLGSVLNPGGYGQTNATTGGMGNDMATIGNLMKSIAAFLPGSWTGAPASTGSGAA